MLPMPEVLLFFCFCVADMLLIDAWICVAETLLDAWVCELLEA